MKYECLKCGFSFEARKVLFKLEQFYTCPNCGGIILGDEWANKIKTKIYNPDDELTPERINELLDSEKEVIDKVVHTGLRTIKKYIVALYSLLKDPYAAIAHKIIAATAIAYIISPLDLIPDIIPGIGFADDVLIVMAAISLIGVALHKYLKDIDSSDLTMIYRIQDGHISDRYIEERPLRVWSLRPDELDKYNLHIINDYLVESPCNYINHPYLWKTLIPIDNYDKLIEKAIQNEEIKLISALGAKRIKVKHQKIQSTKFDAGIDIMTANKIFEGNLDVKNKKLEYSSYEQEYEFNESKELSYDVINDLLWSFTTNSNFEAIFYNRIKRRLSKMTYSTESSTSSFLDIQLRSKIIKNNFGIKVSSSGAIFRKSEYQVEFYQLNMSDSESDNCYNYLMELVNERKNSLKREY